MFEAVSTRIHEVIAIRIHEVIDTRIHEVVSIRIHEVIAIRIREVIVIQIHEVIVTRLREVVSTGIRKVVPLEFLQFSPLEFVDSSQPKFVNGYLMVTRPEINRRCWSPRNKLHIWKPRFRLRSNSFAWLSLVRASDIETLRQNLPSSVLLSENWDRELRLVDQALGEFIPMLSSASARLFSLHPRRALTVNFHFLHECNFSCKFCFATFDDWKHTGEFRPLTHEGRMKVVGELGRTFTKITFAGGEPTLEPRLPDMLQMAKSQGALTNIVTNGSKVTPAWVNDNQVLIDFLTLSADSDRPETHVRLGRATRQNVSLSAQHYIDIGRAALRLGMKLKLNSVVTTVNQDEDIASFVRAVAPIRWKILQAMPIPGQNDRYIHSLIPPMDKFWQYVKRHEEALSGSGIRVVPETIEDIRTSYIMVDPTGRFFDDSKGRYQYSRPILDVGLEAAFGDVVFNLDKFTGRGGCADFTEKMK
jgi:radical S-adenosyl methionine domain-containing protein 2